MGKRQAAQIAALEAKMRRLERDLASACNERDRYASALNRADAEPESLVDTVRGEVERRWGWILDLAGFGR